MIYALFTYLDSIRFIDWLEDEGKIKWKETIVEGLESAPNAFIGLFKGENFDKMLVKIGTEAAIAI